ncbi:MAG: TIGR03546 family protein [Idiomarinaceae bacterium HL-53]|nr:MAG: TIGR03546 family protein [Idiomarinaceae bacterium HL-53]CUS48318.1 TIGR03546 family protein [Idiomarinaceae bacterium HL-53]
MLNLVAKLLRALNSETSSWALAFAAALGMAAGFIPFASLQVLLIFGLVFSLRVNGSFFLVCWLFFTGLAYLLDPLFNSIGEFLLTHSALQEFWQVTTSHAWLWVWQLNHTIVLGATLFVLLVFAPFSWLSHVLVIRYRTQVQKRIERLRVVQVLKGTKVWSLYRKLSVLHSGGDL